MKHWHSLPLRGCMFAGINRHCWNWSASVGCCSWRHRHFPTMSSEKLWFVRARPRASVDWPINQSQATPTRATVFGETDSNEYSSSKQLTVIYVSVTQFQRPYGKCIMTTFSIWNAQQRLYGSDDRWLAILRCKRNRPRPCRVCLEW